MDPDKATQVSYEFKTALSEILPDLTQLLQNYQVTETLEIALEPEFLDVANMATCTCCFVNYVMLCGSAYRPYPSLRAGEEILGLDPAKAHQLGKDIQLKLATVVPRLSQSVKQTNETFKVHLLVDPTIVNDSSTMSCSFVDGVLRCSDQRCSDQTQ